MSEEYDRYANRCLTYHPPKVDRREDYERIRAAAREYARVLFDVCPSSRERSSALTSLEESVAHANGAIAREGH